jgi:hypothetical protein
MHSWAGPSSSESVPEAPASIPSWGHSDSLTSNTEDDN